MFWFQYENIETNNIQYIFQLHNKLLIPHPSFKNSAIEIFLKNTNDQVNLHIFISYNTRNFGYGYNETQIDTIRFEKKKWYHIAYAQDLYKSYLLINGTKFDIEPEKRFMEDLNPALFINIGANLLNGTGNNKTPIIYNEEATNFFNGYIDDFRYYKMCVDKSFIESNIIGKLLNITTSTISSFGNIGITLKQYENKIGIGTYDPITNLHIVGDTLIDGGFSTKNPIEIINVSNIHSTYSTNSNAIVSNNIYINTIEGFNNHLNIFSTNNNLLSRNFECNINIFGSTHFFNTVIFDTQILNNITDDVINYFIPQTEIVKFGDNFSLYMQSEIINVSQSKYRYFFDVTNENNGIDFNIGTGKIQSSNAIFANIIAKTLTVSDRQEIPQITIIDIAEFSNTEINFLQPSVFRSNIDFEGSILSSNQNTFFQSNVFQYKTTFNDTINVSNINMNIDSKIDLKNGKIISSYNTDGFSLTQNELTIDTIHVETFNATNLTATNLNGEGFNSLEITTVSTTGNKSILNILYGKKTTTYGSEHHESHEFQFIVNKEDID